MWDPNTNSYNEFLLDAAVWRQGLPWAINAFIEGGLFSWAEYRGFLRRFGLLESHVPMLSPFVYK